MYAHILGTMFACCYVTSYVPALFTRELSVAAASSPYGTQFSPHVLRRVSCNEKVGNGSAKFSVADAVGLLTMRGSDEEELSEDEIIGDFVTGRTTVTLLHLCSIGLRHQSTALNLISQSLGSQLVHQ